MSVNQAVSEWPFLAYAYVGIESYSYTMDEITKYIIDRLDTFTERSCLKVGTINYYTSKPVQINITSMVYSSL